VPDDPFGLFYKNALTPVTFSNQYIWEPIYSLIYTCNVSIKEIAASAGMSPPVKKQLAGEMKFMRAFLYFQLVNLFGDIPLALTSDYRLNRALPRTPVAQVYQQMMQDLAEAEAALDTAYVDGFGSVVTERVRPNKWAAIALLARVCLYQGNWIGAQAKAGMLIDNSTFILEPDLNKVFLSISNEAIFQIEIRTNNSTEDARAYRTIFGFSTLTPAVLTSAFVSLFSFTDARLIKWVGSYTLQPSSTISIPYHHPNKYKINSTPPTDYVMVLRLAEQYLIRAEARAQQNNLAGAKTDLDAIRLRAGLPGVTVTTKEAMLQAIAHERQVELFTEWGHRWFDLKRTGAMDSLMMRVSAEKGTVWKPHYKLFPIAQEEINHNPNLTQNPGY
jgi:hypothetical protein